MTIDLHGRPLSNPWRGRSNGNGGRMLDSRDWTVARQSVLLARLSDETADLIRSHSMVTSHERGATLFLQGEPATTIFIVLDGWVKLFRISQNGAEAVVGVFTRGQSFGEGAAFQNGSYPVVAEAVTDCRLCRVNATMLLQLMKERPELCSSMLAAVFMHLRELVGQIEQLKARTGAQRVAEFLLDLCPCDSDTCTVVLPYDKVLIAARLGMQPESLSRAFARLKENGVAIRQNSAEIADVEALRDFIEQDRATSWSRA